MNKFLALSLALNFVLVLIVSVSWIVLFAVLHNVSMESPIEITIAEDLRVKELYEFLIFEENISAAEVIIANISAIEHVGGSSSELVAKILLWDWDKIRYHMNETFLMLADYSFVNIPRDDFLSAKKRFYEIYDFDYQQLSSKEKEDIILDMSFIINLIKDNKSPPKKDIVIDMSDSLKS